MNPSHLPPPRGYNSQPEVSRSRLSTISKSFKRIFRRKKTQNNPAAHTYTDADVVGYPDYPNRPLPASAWFGTLDNAPANDYRYIVPFEPGPSHLSIQHQNPLRQVNNSSTLNNSYVQGAVAPQGLSYSQPAHVHDNSWAAPIRANDHAGPSSQLYDQVQYHEPEYHGGDAMPRQATSSEVQAAYWYDTMRSLPSSEDSTAAPISVQNVDNGPAAYDQSSVANRDSMYVIHAPRASRPSQRTYFHNAYGEPESRISDDFHHSSANPQTVLPQAPHIQHVETNANEIQVPRTPVSPGLAMKAAGNGYLPGDVTMDFQQQRDALPVNNHHSVPLDHGIRATDPHAFSSLWGAAAVTGDIHLTQLDRIGYPIQTAPNQATAQQQDYMPPMGPLPNPLPHQSSDSAPSPEGFNAAQSVALPQVVKTMLLQQHMSLPLEGDPFAVRPPAGWNMTWQRTLSIVLKAPISVGECLFVLANCPYLEAFECSVKSTLGYQRTAVHKRLTAEHLLRLQVTFCTSPRNLFERVELPQLTSLHVQWDKRRGHLQEKDVGIYDMMHCSTLKTLQELVLLDIYPADEELLNCLAMACGLRRLVVSTDLGSRQSPATLHGKVISRRTLLELASGDLCHHLTDVQLSPLHPHDDEFLKNMVLSRDTIQHITYLVDSADQERHTKLVNSLSAIIQRGNQPLRMTQVIY